MFQTQDIIIISNTKPRIQILPSDTWLMVYIQPLTLFRSKETEEGIKHVLFYTQTFVGNQRDGINRCIRELELEYRDLPFMYIFCKDSSRLILLNTNKNINKKIYVNSHLTFS